MITYPEGGMPGMVLAHAQKKMKAGINNIRVQLVPLRPVPRVRIAGAGDVAKLVYEMEDYDREWAKIIHLDTKNLVLGVETISIGSLSATIVHPRETVKGAILNNSSAVIFVHNHPSGACEPSQEDQVMHDTLARAFEYIAIRFLDSVIVGKGCYYSLEERRLAKQPLQIPLVTEPGIEEDIDILEEISRKRLAENLELFRKKVALESEIEQLKKDIANARIVCPAISVVPAAPAIHTEHGSRYLEFKKRVAQASTPTEISETADEIFEIVEEGNGGLTMEDINELLPILRKKIFEEKRMTRKPIERRVEAPPPVPQIYKYTRPDIRATVFKTKRFVRDLELERTIVSNKLLTFAPEWYLLPPEEKLKKYGADVPTAFRKRIDLRIYSWDDLTAVYGIPAEYVQAWKMAASVV